MGLKEILQPMIELAVQVPLLDRAVVGIYELRSSRAGWNREHPYDRVYGVRTGGSLPGFLLLPGATAYVAAQPSIVRRALAVIPDPRHCHFLDLGCGKGRPLLVATEFDFPTITGVEFSPALARVARSNAAVFSHAHPERTRIDIVAGDALAYRLPGEQLVIFLYNPFNQTLMSELLSNIEKSLAMIPRDLYIVYYNPAWANLLDASTALERRYAAQFSYEPSEIGYGPDESDAVVIWQNRGNPHPLPPGRANAPVTIVSASWRAEIATQG